MVRRCECAVRVGGGYPYPACQPSGKLLRASVVLVLATSASILGSIVAIGGGIFLHGRHVLLELHVCAFHRGYIVLSTAVDRGGNSEQCTIYKPSSLWTGTSRAVLLFLCLTIADGLGDMVAILCVLVRVVRASTVDCGAMYALG